MNLIKKIVFAGNPNVGKSTLFNALTGLKQHTGNWTGKTVELASGSYIFENRKYCLYDIPGTYSVFSNSPEEEIARENICYGDADVIVVVADATCLERNLNLALQILEMNHKVILCINLVDEANRNGIFVDTEALKEELRIPVIGITAKNKNDVERFKSFLARNINKIDEKTKFAYTTKYVFLIEKALIMLSRTLPTAKMNNSSLRFVALKLLEDTNKTLGELKKHLNLSGSEIETIANTITDIKNHLIKENISQTEIHDIVTETLSSEAKRIAVKAIKKSNQSDTKTLKFDRILTSKAIGIPIMLCFFGLILWLTISGANYPSQLLFDAFGKFSVMLENFFEILHMPELIRNILIDGIYTTVTWIVSVMLPPMAIFFPLFTLMEDLGYLPRIAFNLDKCFKSANSSGKQALTMCMGLGCNAVGVTGCRIISSPEERIAAILTNTFMPCNGRFSLLITLSVIFIATFFPFGNDNLIAAIFVLFLIVLGVLATLLVTKILSLTLLKHNRATFILELPPYRKPQILSTILRSVIDRTLCILGRAIVVSAPAGLIIWGMANISVDGETLLRIFADFLKPFANLMGFDGYILLAFILGMPANEIVLPIIIMCYMSSTQMVGVDDINKIRDLFYANGWTTLTAVNVMLFSLLHFPCATTLFTINKETGSLKWTILSFIIPTLIGILVCMLTNGIYLILT